MRLTDLITLVLIGVTTAAVKVQPAPVQAPAGQSVQTVQGPLDTYRGIKELVDWGLAQKRAAEKDGYISIRVQLPTTPKVAPMVEPVPPIAKVEPEPQVSLDPNDLFVYPPMPPEPKVVTVQTTCENGVCTVRPGLLGRLRRR